MTDRSDLAAELQRTYDSEINVEIGWFWDRRIDLRLGDPMNGYLAEQNVPSVAEIIPWFQAAIAHFFQTSTYAISLGREAIEAAARMVFRPPTIGASVTCPHCGAPNPSRGFDELLAFICARCGSAVKVEPPKVKQRSCMDHFPLIPHQHVGGGIDCPGRIIAETPDPDHQATLRCDECFARPRQPHHESR